MALTYSTFQTFAEVEVHYNKIKPLRGKDNEGKDIRPIGDRRRKWERIVKISPNCYALSDGHHFGDEISPAWVYGAEAQPITLADMEKYAPIVWRKRRDGLEEVTLRNGWGPGLHTSRYQFLYRHTPKGMWFRTGNRDGKHFIEASGERYYLAKVRTTPRHVYDAINNAASNHYWQKRMKDWVRLQDDNSALTFTNLQGRWTLVDGGKEVPTPPKVIVRKELKAKYKKHIDVFKEWAFTMGPMLPLHDYNYIRDMNSQAAEWCAEQSGGKRHYWGDPLMHIDFKIKRQIMCDEEHPMRLHMAVSMLRNIELYNVDDEDGARRCKQRANTWINNHMNFTKKV